MENKKNILLVNAVTTLRVLGIFFLLPVYLAYGGIGLGLTNIFCFLTDFVDGKLARKLNASTFFGSLYDGFSDKMFIAMNLLILAFITPWALVPALLELGIAGVQCLKFKDNLKVKSNMFGKVKMWVVGLSVVVMNFLFSADVLNFLGNNLINKIASLEKGQIVKAGLIPIILSEIVTLTSYINEFIKEKKDIKESEVKDIEKEEILKKEEKEVKSYPIKEMLFDADFYAQHKDESPLKLLRSKPKR